MGTVKQHSYRDTTEGELATLPLADPPWLHQLTPGRLYATHAGDLKDLRDKLKEVTWQLHERKEACKLLTTENQRLKSKLSKFGGTTTLGGSTLPTSSYTLRVSAGPGILHSLPEAACV
jgi:hypothetical protein